jgi:hypothetical protein
MKLLPVVYKIFELQKTITNNVNKQTGRTHKAAMLESIQNEWAAQFINITYEDKTLKTILGPDYKAPMPELPIYNGYTGSRSNDPADKVQQLVDAMKSVITDYYTKLMKPFITVLEYVIQELVLQLPGNFTNLLTNYISDQASIKNLQGMGSMVSAKFTPTWMTTTPSTDTTTSTTDDTKSTTSAWSPWNTTKSTDDTKSSTSAWSPWNTTKSTDDTKSTDATKSTTSAWSAWDTSKSTTSAWSPWNTTSDTKKV